jgi:hypothetical protein
MMDVIYLRTNSEGALKTFLTRVLEVHSMGTLLVERITLMHLRVFTHI